MTPCFVSSSGVSETHITCAKITGGSRETKTLCGETIRVAILYAMPRKRGENVGTICEQCSEKATTAGIKWRSR